MRRSIPLAALLAAALWGGGADALEAERVDAALQLAAERAAKTAARLTPTQFPSSTDPAGLWRTIPNTDAVGWVQGFFPGILWYLRESTGAEEWRDRADQWTRTLEAQQHNRETHDLGFKLLPSFGQAWRLTGDAYYRDVLLTAAESLASRFEESVGIINTGDWNPRWEMPMVVDTMVNLELLAWASANGGRAELLDMALRHALRTAQDMVRADGGTWHVVDYDREAGAVRLKETFQGYSDDSTWSRGQVWAMYGFTVMYRYTSDPRMLEAARKVTDYYLAHLPEDWIPKWDFQAPGDQRDSSAAAAAAAALLELSLHVPDDGDRIRYRDAALRTLEALVQPPYLSEGVNTEAVLLHGVGHLPAGKEIDVGLIYGDYYFVEALLRVRGRTAVIGAPQVAFPDLLASGTSPPPGAPPAPFEEPQPEPERSEPRSGCGTSGSTLAAWAAVLLAVPLLTRGRRATRRSARP